MLQADILRGVVVRLHIVSALQTTELRRCRADSTLPVHSDFDEHPGESGLRRYTAAAAHPSTFQLVSCTSI
jgi:hypothetical protein